MIALIENHQSEIASLCRRHGIKRLELFGSAARGTDFNSNSDIDLFVEFLDYESPSLADQWFGIQEDLDKMLGRHVDLTSIRAVDNPYFLEVANRHREILYAA